MSKTSQSIKKSLTFLLLVFMSVYTLTIILIGKDKVETLSLQKGYLGFMWTELLLGLQSQVGLVLVFPGLFLGVLAGLQAVWEHLKKELAWSETTFFQTLRLYVPISIVYRILLRVFEHPAYFVDFFNLFGLGFAILGFVRLISWDRKIHGLICQGLKSLDGQVRVLDSKVVQVFTMPGRNMVYMILGFGWFFLVGYGVFYGSTLTDLVLVLTNLGWGVRKTLLSMSNYVNLQDEYPHIFGMLTPYLWSRTQKVVVGVVMTAATGAGLSEAHHFNMMSRLEKAADQYRYRAHMFDPGSEDHKHFMNMARTTEGFVMERRARGPVRNALDDLVNPVVGTTSKIIKDIREIIQSNQ